MSGLPEGVKPFDRSEIEPCVNCGRGIGHAGDIVFYEVLIGQVVVDMKSIRRQVGMEMVIGNPAIAAMMSDTTRIGYRLPPSRMIVCQTCLLDEGLTVADLWQRYIDRQEAVLEAENAEEEEQE